jgi:2-polyprenyl-6-methoxyphenol hydroxylase-like FAD-dependent oxidoreductase
MHLGRVEVIGGGPAGLFAARLIKERMPDATVRVSERSVPDDTFGFGVAFTARTLRAVAEAEQATFGRLVEASVPMPQQEMLIDGVSVRAKGTGGGIAIARSRLLEVLLDEAVRAGVEVDLGAERDLGDVRDADLVVAADGVGSRTRAELAEHLGGRVVPGRGVFMWLGCGTRLRSNLFVPVRTEHGLFTIHGYPYAEERSTLGVEADVGTWRRAGMDIATAHTPLTESDAFSIDYLQKAFADALEGAELLGNRSRWMRFRTVSLPRWHHENVVLIGDAAHTAHYSVGSGTKMALEDAIVLADSLAAGAEPALAGALRQYEEIRRPRVEVLQDAAVRSQRWWDSIGHRLDLPAPQLMLAYLSRGGMVSTSRLAEGDPGLLRAGLAAFAGVAPTDDELADARAWVLNRPYEGAALHTSGRVLDEYGQAGYREVHGEPFAVTALRAAYPDETLAAVLGTDVDDPWSPAADEVLDRCFALAEAGADGVRLEGRPGRPALLDRLALAERIRRQTKLFTVVGAQADHIDDLVDGVVAGRADLVAIAG